MGGIYVRCGSFEGEDKSCSPIQAVIEDLTEEASGPEREALSRIESLLNESSDDIVIDTNEAELLTSLVNRYRARIAARIAPISDPFEQIEKDYRDNPDLDPTEAKYGKSLGWKYLCVLDLERAFAVSAEEAEPVIISSD